ncbi:MAG TPA: ABC transporter permease [Opitutaceae bacterium]|nr:ABC transporter permease [Opitutaceae bacterium]
MSQILILLRKSLLNFSRARAAIAITFIVPIALIYLFGHVFGLFGNNPGPEHIKVAVVNESPEPAARELMRALKAEKTFDIVTEARNANGTVRPLTEADVRQALYDNNYRYALILPSDMYRDGRFGVRIKFLTNPRNEIEAQTVNGVLQKTIFSNVPQLLGQSLQRSARNYLGDERYARFNQTMADTIANTFGGDPAVIRERMEAGNFFGAATTGRQDEAPAVAGGLRRLDVAKPAGTADGTTQPAATAPASNDADRKDLFSRIVNIQTEQVAGKQTKNPMAARTVGGYAIMFLLFAVSGSATSIFEERDAGVYQRLLSSPVRPSHVLWARFLFGIVLGLVQIGVLLLAGQVFFGLQIFQHAAALFAIMLTGAAACSAFGMLIAAFAPSAAAANGIATFVVLSMSAVGGAWFPTSFMPGYIQTFSKMTLVYWAVEGLTDVLWAGRSLLEVLPKAGILAGIAFVVMLVSVWRFNRSKFFE